ncbi:hypothetical protein ASG40_06005 [Methylobacterium sp. Leaf399]|uniref:hypothetical protein n=1 Tax=unclassified Methylobacterium TaxID=2615210 RepID=UPI0006F3F13D|nr:MULTISPECIES: hypothetical protein [unclassified Methylobacterium]KQP51731.1 hypothetical protein ASF39_08115 [Methylobacterium sp. Leaf108]KQT14852.1 hypothetical protein ASG40_06005 [Methylobacterium sp. Leaf399]KQT90517.1 hypothetical protein ASG59_01625 [Methylobacterium sp. Leaf466]
MMNFILGTIAGGLIACIATIAAARHPEVQQRLGLVPAVPALTLAAGPQRTEAPCAPSSGKGTAEATVGQTDMLFSRRRFWFVAPH